MRRRRQVAVLLALGLGTAGCTPYFQQTDARSTLSEPGRVAADRIEDDQLPPPVHEGTIARAYGERVDAQLQPLIAEAMASSPDVEIALASIEESRAIADQTRAARMPTVNGQLSGTVGRSITPGIGAVDSRSAVFSLPVAYEVDLTGRYAIDHHAAQTDVLAAQADADAAALSVAAEVAEAYFDLINYRAKRAVLEQQKALNEQRLALVQDRVRAGLAGDVELRQQQQLVLGIEAQLAPLDALDAQTALRLSVMLGREPGSRYEGAPAELPVPPPLDRDGVSADELVGRPDVRAAMLRLEATDARIESAVRTQMPQLRLSATPGYTFLHAERSGVQANAQGFTWSINGLLTVPIFDGLRQHNLITQRRAEVDRRLAQLDRSLRLAMVEATAAISAEQQARAVLASVESQLALATSLREDAERQYRQGMTSFVNVLLATITEQGLQITRLDAQRAVLAARVRFMRAVAPE